MVGLLTVPSLGLDITTLQVVDSLREVLTTPEHMNVSKSVLRLPELDRNLLTFMVAIKRPEKQAACIRYQTILPITTLIRRTNVSSKLLLDQDNSS